ncbi:MAG: tRNA-guanine transglycosylase [Cyanobacteria bacterium P01_A01_bin.17]
MVHRHLKTRRGEISFPAYVPVTTFGKKYPLDDLIRPYLNRLAPAIMVSYHYAQQMSPDDSPRLPMFVDSGGFAALFEGSRIRQQKGLGVLEIKRGDTSEQLHPKAVLAFQEAIADVALTLDFPIPPGLDTKEAKRRQRLTIANAHWALDNRRRRDLPLYACIQAWDVASARRCARQYAGAGFDGVAIGGLVPRSRDLNLVLGIVRAVREEIGDLPLHVLGLGHPNLLPQLFEAGTDSVDSSSYVKYAANGQLWGQPHERIEEPTPTDRLHLALCNLATATGKTLPLSAAQMLFSTLRTP